MHREGMEKGSAVFPQVSPRPLTFSMNMVEPFTLNTSPVFAELMAGTLDEPGPGLRRSGVAPAGPRRVGVGTPGRSAAALGDVRA